MAIRIFRCRDCGHRMRLGWRRCGLCHADKPAYQRWLGWIGVGGLAFGLAILIVP